MAHITLNNVSVDFPIFNSSSRSLKKKMIGMAAGGNIRTDSGPTYIQALDDISLDLADGDRLALIGPNGAGKTTLLRVLAGIYEPTAGKISTAGRVAPLFDISLGMDPDNTGYENIILRGLFLGLSRAEIEDKKEEIADFTELGEYLNLPMRTYSTGMATRLAFAISTSIDPDILLLDEGIGAGDAAFIEKANQRLDEFMSRAAIIVLASHSEQLVQQICSKAILMNSGRVSATGDVESVLEAYRAQIHNGHSA